MDFPRSEPRLQAGTKEQASPWTARQKQIERVLPKKDLSLMTESTWRDLYRMEAECSPFDANILGNAQRQKYCSRHNRNRIVHWMSEAVSVLGWTAPTFFTAVAALDKYLTTMSEPMPMTMLGAAATGCMYFGANLTECAIDENMYSLERFADICSSVSPRLVREMQTHILETLQGRSLNRKTPFELLLLFLAALRQSPFPGVLINCSLERDNSLAKMFDVLILHSVFFYCSGLCLNFLGSAWVAAGMLTCTRRIMNAVQIQFPEEVGLRDFMLEEVFHAPADWAITVLQPLSDQVLNRCWQLVTGVQPVYPAPTRRPTSIVHNAWIYVHHHEHLLVLKQFQGDVDQLAREIMDAMSNEQSTNDENVSPV